MKRARWIIRILAIVAPVLSFSLFRIMSYIIDSAPPAKGFERNQFTEQEQAEICDMLQLELAPGESISTICQDDTVQLLVYDVASKESFLARLHAKKRVQFWGQVWGGLEYYLPADATEFYLSGAPYDCWRSSFLYFGPNTAGFVLGGFLSADAPELVRAQNIVLKYVVERPPAVSFLFTHYWLFSVVIYSGIALELGFIITLLILRRKAKKEKLSCQLNPS